jgi:preprotein translocase subunit SecY
MELPSIVHYIPEVQGPIEKKLSFNVKLKWTMIILGAFFILANIPLFGLASNSLSRFEYLAIVLGTDFGSIISLGIGPIVMASIIIQLLVGSGILAIDTSTSEGRQKFQGLQKMGVIFFILFEATVYVIMGGLQANPGMIGVVIFQLILGGLAIFLMDQLAAKWGFGSGTSLFILAGVAWRVFTGLFQFVGQSGENCLANFSNTPCAGSVLVILQSIINGAPSEALSAFATIIVTAVIFIVVVWVQNLKVEIPLSHDRIRGYNIKWPLPFFYSSNLPVILVAALVANIQLFGGLLENWLGHATILGGFSQGTPISGFAFWLGHSNIIGALIRGSLQTSAAIQGVTHIVFYMIAAAIFSLFWVKTSGMDESSQAKKIMQSGLQIPGFRKDERVLEAVLKRYIMPLTIMGGLAIGLLAALSDTLGALTSGTAILLAIMISNQLYQSIAQQHAVDMHPALRKMMG